MSRSDSFRETTSISRGGVTIATEEFPDLQAGANWGVARQAWFLNRSGTRLRRVRVDLENGSIRVERGSLQYSVGDVSVSREQSDGIKGFGKKLASKFLSEEKLVHAIFRGTGSLYLEPTVGHIGSLELEGDELVVDAGGFCCSTPDVEIGVFRNEALSGYLDEKNWFQTKLSGEGVCALHLPVPLSECHVVELDDSTLQVDGNMALLRLGDLEYTVESVGGSLMGSLAAGEGFVQTFRGTGRVWLAPTRNVYRVLSTSGVSGLGVGRGQPSGRGS